MRSLFATPGVPRTRAAAPARSTRGGRTRGARARARAQQLPPRLAPDDRLGVGLHGLELGLLEPVGERQARRQAEEAAAAARIGCRGVADRARGQVDREAAAGLVVDRDRERGRGLRAAPAEPRRLAARAVDERELARVDGQVDRDARPVGVERDLALRERDGQERVLHADRVELAAHVRDDELEPVGRHDLAAEGLRRGVARSDRRRGRRRARAAHRISRVADVNVGLDHARHC